MHFGDVDAAHAIVLVLIFNGVYDYMVYYMIILSCKLQTRLPIDDRNDPTTGNLSTGISYVFMPMHTFVYMYDMREHPKRHTYITMHLHWVSMMTHSSHILR